MAYLPRYDQQSPWQFAMLPDTVTDRADILIVEDNPQMALALSQLLELQGYRTTVASTGREAFRHIARRPPDLILLDIHLPDVDGLYICAELKRSDLNRHIPIIIVTASGERQNQLASIKAGAEGYVQKPVDPEELEARVGTLLRVKRMNDDLEPAESVIFTLARTVEAKDPYTEGHLQRLAMYATAIGRTMGMGEGELTTLRYGAILHDVGKVGIDETIIRKPGPLTPDEYRLMQQHALIGERIVSPLRMASRVAPIVRNHHERWNGSGYPDGLVGDDIPLGARIVSVVDAFDAMTTQRPYNRVKSHSEAAYELWGGRGIFWDPAIVLLFLRTLTEEKLLTW